MEDKHEISSIEEVKSFMQKIQPELEKLLKMFYELKKNVDDKNEINELLVDLENQFNYLTETTKKYKSSNKHILNFLNSIVDFAKKDEIRTGSMISRKVSTDFFELMRATKKGFEYGYWGKMNKRLQQLYLRIYSYYSKCTYELIKTQIENKN
ncbi:MAG: hypothetical protein R3E32_28295 [Chitinophagales bacterium]